MGSDPDRITGKFTKKWETGITAVGIVFTGISGGGVGLGSFNKLYNIELKTQHRVTRMTTIMIAPKVKTDLSSILPGIGTYFLNIVTTSSRIGLM